MTASHDESGQITREALTLSASNYLCRVLYLVRGMGVAALLQPELYGVWSVLKALQDSSAFSGLGSSFALLRELPINEAAGNKDKNTLLQSTALNLALLVSGAISVLILLLSFTPLIPNIGAELRISLIVMMLSTIVYYLPRQLQAQREFYAQARFLLVYAFFNAVLSLLAVYFWDLKAMLWSLVIANVLSLAYMVRSGHLQLQGLFDSKLARVLMKQGLPVMIGSALFFFLRAADQFMIYAMIGSAAAGYYALSGFVAMTVTQIPVALAAALFPRMMERHTAGASRQEIEHLYFEPLQIVGAMIPVLLGGTYLVMEPFLGYMLKGYMPALMAIRITLLGLFFQSIWSLSHSLLLTFDKQRQQMQLSIALFIVSVAVLFVVIRLGGQIEAVAWVATAISVLAAALVLFYIFHLLERGTASNMRTCLMLLWPLAYCTFMVLLVDGTIHHSEGPWQMLTESLVKGVVFLMTCGPLFYVVWRQIARLKDAADVGI